MAGIILITVWGLLLAVTAWWLLGQPAVTEPAGPAPDPYASEVARFRRELHDWDRAGGLG